MSTEGDKVGEDIVDNTISNTNLLQPKTKLSLKLKVRNQVLQLRIYTIHFKV